MLFSTVALLVAVAAGGNLPAEPAAAAPSPAGVTRPPGPRIRFASTVYDFGRAMSGTQIEHDFAFTNTGDALLEIQGVYPSCHCTVAKPWTRRVEPGGTGIIPLVFDSSRFNGRIERTANVVWNDSTQPDLRLQIQGTLWKPLEVSPQIAVVKVVQDSPTNPAATVTILSNLEEPVTLSDPVYTNAAFAAELKTLRPGREFQLVLRAVPPFRQGAVEGTILLKTSSTNMPAVEVTAVVIVQPGFSVTPQQITLPPGPLDRQVTYAVTVQNNASRRLALSEPTLNGAGAGIEMNEVVPGHQFTLTCTFPSGFQIPHGGQVNLTVRTSDPAHPVIRVPVYQGVWTGPRDIGLPGMHRGPVPPTAAPPKGQPG